MAVPVNADAAASFGMLNRVQFALFLDKERECLRCQHTFTLRNNLGRLKCTGFHPLPISTDGRQYECCRRRPGSAGCCGADHIDFIDIHHKPHSFERANKTVLTFEQFRILAINRQDCQLYVQNKTWHHSASGGEWIVDRIDFPRYYDRRNKLLHNDREAISYAYEKWRPDPY